MFKYSYLPSNNGQWGPLGFNMGIRWHEDFLGFPNGADVGFSDVGC